MDQADQTANFPHSRPSKQRGSCHCGAVRFEASIDVASGAGRCNCTICTKMGQTSSLMKPDAFTLLSGEADLGVYEWAHKVSKRFFCRHCGVHCFGEGYLEEVGGAFVSVNWNCLDDIDVSTVKVIHWDGRHDNWNAGPRDTPWPIA